ncbi:MAG: hypothetical protein M1820_002201 [Bogoriella megaspora]|nr:MAG: hypothetical protein M1820_002201 [Bogoriella megaspora]
MDVYTPELASALLGWINSFRMDAPVKSWNELRDGRILWKILQDIDRNYFNGELPSEGDKTAKDYVGRLQNGGTPRKPDLHCKTSHFNLVAVKYIEKHVARYIHQELGKLPNLVNKLVPSLDGVAGDEATKQAPKLAMTILLCAMYSPESNQRMIDILQGLGEGTTGPIVEKINEIQAADQQVGEDTITANGNQIRDAISTPGSLRPSRSHSPDVDPDLKKEEQYIQLHQQLRQAAAKNASLEQDLREARRKEEDLTEELAEERLHLKTGQTSENEELEYLKDQSTKDAILISQLESDLETCKGDLESSTRQLQKLQNSSGPTQALKDRVQLLTAELDEAVRENKANGNLKKKIESLQEQVRRYDELKESIRSLREQQQDYDSLKSEKDTLTKANDQHSKTIQTIEQSLWETREAKRRVESDMRVVYQKMESMREKQQRDHETKQELQERIDELEGNQGTSQGLGSLEEELALDEENQEKSVNYTVLLMWLRGIALTSLRKAKETQVKPPVAGIDESQSLRQQLTTVTTELEDQKFRLRSAMAAAEALQKESAAQEEEIKLILSQLKTACAASADESVLDDTAKLLANRIEEGRQMVDQASKVTSQLSVPDLSISDYDNTTFLLNNARREPLVDHAPIEAVEAPAPRKRCSWFRKSVPPALKAAGEPMASQAKMGVTLEQQIEENRAIKEKSKSKRNEPMLPKNELEHYKSNSKRRRKTAVTRRLLKKSRT